MLEYDNGKNRDFPRSSVSMSGWSEFVLGGSLCSRFSMGSFIDVVNTNLNRIRYGRHQFLDSFHAGVRRSTV